MAEHRGPTPRQQQLGPTHAGRTTSGEEDDGETEGHCVIVTKLHCYLGRPPELTITLQLCNLVTYVTLFSFAASCANLLKKSSIIFFPIASTRRDPMAAIMPPTCTSESQRI